MALPELTKKQVEKILGDFCERRIPPHAKGKVRLSFSFVDETVSLIEERPVYNDPSQWTQMPIAQFRFNLDDKTWSLYCCDRNSKWHLYDRVNPTRQINHLVKEVEHDPTRIFWG